MLKYFGLLLILVGATLAASFAKKYDKPKIFGIVGGKEGTIMQYPFQVSVKLNRNGIFDHYCGGSIIRADFIVTAAHCIQNRHAKYWRIAAGSSTRNGADAVEVDVDKITVHEKYNTATYENDIALMFLKKLLPIDYVKIAPIALATHAPTHGSLATVTGWGATSFGGYGSNKLLEAEVPIINNNRCNAYYTAIFGNDRIKSNMICAGIEGVGGKDACQGDSGGPLTYDGKLVGVVSWGHGCARPDAPGVYASAAYFRGWIYDNC